MIKHREDVQEFNYEQLLAILEGQEKMVSKATEQLRKAAQSQSPDTLTCKSLSREIGQRLQGLTAVVEEMETRPEYRPSRF
jgi:hypothetical protein